MKHHCFLFGGLLLLTSCASYKPAILENNCLRNPTVGENGYVIQIPEDFVFQPREPLLQTPPARGVDEEIATFYKTSENVARFSAHEDSFAFKKGEEIIAVSVSQLDIPALYLMSDDEQSQLLDQIMAQSYGSRFTQFSQKIKIAGRPAVYVENSSPNGYFFVHYFVLGNLDEFYYLGSSGPPSGRAEVKERAWRLVQSLKF